MRRVPGFLKRSPGTRFFSSAGSPVDREGVGRESVRRVRYNNKYTFIGTRFLVGRASFVEETAETGIFMDKGIDFSDRKTYICY